MKRSPNLDRARVATALTSPLRKIASGSSQPWPKISGSSTLSSPMPGISGRTPTGSTDEAIFENVIHTNLNAAFFTVNSAAPLLNDNGSIIFNGSVHNYLGQPGVAAYAATKGGLVSMARSIAADLAPRNIRVNVVAPGAIKTPIWKRGPRASASAEDSAKLAKFFSSAVPQGRWGEPEEVAKAVLFLASDDSSYVNAVELMVDGGATGAPFGAPILRN